MKTFTIGRTAENDICIEDRSVSVRHAELVITVGNDLYLNDCASTNGTAVFREGSWQSVRQDFILVDERLQFGRYEMSVNDLLAHARTAETEYAKRSVGADAIRDEVIDGPVQRDEFGRPVRKG